VLTGSAIDVYSLGTMNTAEQLRNRLWDAREAANFLKVSRSWIYARVERDEMPYIRVGGLIRFVPSQLRDWTFAKDQGKG
jgi:excisionase family DNA binding protein